MKENKKKKFHFRLPKLTPLNLILMITIPILLFVIIAIPILYVNEYNANKVTPFASEIENVNKKEIVYGNKNTITDFNFILYCTDYNNSSGTVKFQGLLYENEKTRSIIPPTNKVSVKLGMYSDWIKVEKTSSTYQRTIATGPENSLSSSSRRFDFTINSVPTLPQKGKLPFINIKSIPLYAYVTYTTVVNGTETQKKYILKYNYSDYVIDSKTIVDTREKELNVTSSTSSSTQLPNIQWKYKNDTSWKTFMNTDQLIGIEARVQDGYIQWKRKCDSEWNNIREISSLPNYEEGKTVEVSIYNGYLRWKYTDQTNWTNIYSTLSTGLNGIERVRVEDGYIQWKRYNSDWHNLKNITELENYSEDKSVEVRISGGNVQWRYTDGDWKTLQTVDSLIGVEVRFDNGKVQWKCADDTEWKVIILNGEEVTKDNLGDPIKYGPTSGGIN